jgi:hypothetical protein
MRQALNVIMLLSSQKTSSALVILLLEQKELRLGRHWALTKQVFQILPAASASRLKSAKGEIAMGLRSSARLRRAPGITIPGGENKILIAACKRRNKNPQDKPMISSRLRAAISIATCWPR